MSLARCLLDRLAMKLMLLVVSSFALIGCGENTGADTEKLGGSTPAEPAQAKPVEQPTSKPGPTSDSKSDVEARVAAPRTDEKMSAFRRHTLGMLEKLIAIKDEMCKCPPGNQECGARIDDKLLDLVTSRNRTDKPEPGDKAELERLVEPIMADYDVCRFTAMTLPESSAPPPKKLNGAQAKVVAALAKTTELKDAMCKCKQADTDCVLAVMKVQKEWGEEPRTTPSDGSKMTADEKAAFMSQLDLLMKDYKKCMSFALAATR